MNKKESTLIYILFVALSFLTSIAVAQDNYPSAPIRLVWGGGAPGGRPDSIARLLTQKLSTQMNAKFYVDNKQGASGNIGAEFVARSNPDGYTLLFDATNQTLSAALGQKLGYNLLRDLAPISLVATGSQLIITHPSVPANTIAQFIVYIRANPNKVAYGSSGNGGLAHLSALLFLQANNLTALHVPYKGAVPVGIDLAAGRIQFSVVDVASGVPLVKKKLANALAITSLKRSPLLPDVPTVSETMPGFEIVAWYDVMAPVKTPRPIILKLNSEIVKTLQDPDLVAKFKDLDALPLGSTPEGDEAFLRTQLERWTKVIKIAGIKPEE